MSDAAHDASERALLGAGTHHDPHRYLGVHRGVVRAFHPDAVRCEAFCESGAAPLELAAQGSGVFAGALPAGAAAGLRPRVRSAGARFCSPGSRA